MVYISIEYFVLLKKLEYPSKEILRSIKYIHFFIMNMNSVKNINSENQFQNILCIIKSFICKV